MSSIGGMVVRRRLLIVVILMEIRDTGLGVQSTRTVFIVLVSVSVLCIM